MNKTVLTLEDILDKADDVSKAQLANLITGKDSWVRQVAISELLAADSTDATCPVNHIYQIPKPNVPSTTIQQIGPGDIVYRYSFSAYGGSTLSKFRVREDSKFVLRLERDSLPAANLALVPGLSPELVEFLSPTTEDGLNNGLLPDGFGWVGGVTIAMQRKRVTGTALLMGFGLDKETLDFILKAILNSPNHKTVSKWANAIKLPLWDYSNYDFDPVVGFRDFWFFIYDDATGDYIETGVDRLASLPDVGTILGTDNRLIRAINCRVAVEETSGNTYIDRWELYSVN